MRCTLCEAEVAEENLFAHVENVHVGPSEVMKVACASCPFTVVRDRIDLMASHCLLLGHDPMGVRSDWVREERRSLSIFQIVFQMMMVKRNQTPEKDQKNPPSSSHTPNSQQPGRKRTRPNTPQVINTPPGPAQNERNNNQIQAVAGVKSEPMDEEKSEMSQRVADGNSNSSMAPSIADDSMNSTNGSLSIDQTSTPLVRNGGHQNENILFPKNFLTNFATPIPITEGRPLCDADFLATITAKDEDASNGELTAEQLIMQAIPVTVTEPVRDPATLIKCCLCDQEIVAYHRNTRKLDGKPSLKMRFLTNHVLTHHLKDVRPFYCTGCGYSSARPDKLKIHTQKCQVKEKAEVAGGIDAETGAKIRSVMEQAFPEIDFSSRKISV